MRPHAAGEAASPNQPFAAPRRFPGITIAVAALVVLVDQAAKATIASHYTPDQVIASWPLVSLVFVVNRGGVCGYAQGAGTLLAIVGGVTAILIGLSIVFVMPPSLVHAAAFGMLLAGTAGNLIDRLRLGYVVDFITLDWLRLPSFNIADCAILGGILLVGLITLHDISSEHQDGESRSSLLALTPATMLLFLTAGLLLAAAYVLCVFRPFG